ncbi:hypothetical protein V4R08_15995 (plasmid) [Nitrobacter sp. NHB1]|uniref:hypothetical protein n=1 Tax=Nitrobacter sp. NHB1 TaxID=3119830 RepID=UPI002FFD86EA
MIVVAPIAARIGRIDLRTALKKAALAFSIRCQRSNADEAFAILENRSDTALLYPDIQMDGLDLARTVHDRWPAIEIILVSGQVEMSERERPANSRFY